LLARSQYPEGPATGHLGTDFFFLLVYKRMLRWFPRLQVATTCFSYAPPDLHFLDPYFIFMYCTCIITTATGRQHICSQICYYIIIITRHLMLAYFQILLAGSLVTSHRPTGSPVCHFFKYATFVSGDIYQNSSCYFFTLTSLEVFG